MWEIRHDTGLKTPVYFEVESFIPAVDGLNQLQFYTLVVDPETTFLGQRKE